MAKEAKGKTTKRRAPAPKPETIEEHMRRLGCFSPGEVAALLKVDISHEHIDELARNKGVGIAPPVGIAAEAEAIIQTEAAPSRAESVSENEGGEEPGETSQVETPASHSEEASPETPAP